MASLFVRFKKYFRRIVDGAGERCRECNRPINYAISGSEYVPLRHRCRSRPPGRISRDLVLDDGENDQEDEDLCEGSRIERGFAMAEMASDLDYVDLGFIR